MKLVIKKVIYSIKTHYKMNAFCILFLALELYAYLSLIHPVVNKH